MRPVSGGTYPRQWCDLNNLTAVAIAVNIVDGYIVEAWDDRGVFREQDWRRAHWQADPE